MAGFLEGLGDFAGGVAKGIESDTANRARRAQARAAEEAATRAREADEREGKLAWAVGGAPLIDQPIGSVEDIYAARTAARPVAADPQEAGLVGKLAGLFSRRSIRQTSDGAGLTTPAPQVGLGLAAPAAAPAATPAAETPATRPLDQVNMPGLMGAAASAPPAPAAAPAAGPEPATPDTVPVAGSGGQKMRPATEIDRQLYLAKAYAEARQPDKANEHYKQYGDLVIDRKLRAFDTASPANLSYMASQTTGVPTKITENSNGTWSMSVTEKDANGKDTEVTVLRNVPKGELKANIAGELLRPEVREKLIADSREEFTKMMESQAKIAGYASTRGLAEAQTAQIRQKTSGERVEADRETQFRDSVKKFSAPGASLLDPVGYTSWAEENAILSPKGFITTETASDPETLTQIKTQVNDRLQHQQAERDEWEGNPLVKHGLVQIVNAPGGGKTFGVLDNQGNVGAMFPTQGQAYGYAQIAYPDPVAAGTAIRRVQDARKVKPGTAGAAAPAAKPGTAPAAKPTAAPAAPRAPVQRPATEAGRQSATAKLFTDDPKRIKQYNEDKEALRVFDARRNKGQTPALKSIQMGATRSRVEEFERQLRRLQPASK